MSRSKKPVHLIGISKTITPCGRSFDFNVLNTSFNTKHVTCKKCKKTNWFKEQKIIWQRDKR